MQNRWHTAMQGSPLPLDGASSFKMHVKRDSNPIERSMNIAYMTYLTHATSPFSLLSPFFSLFRNTQTRHIHQNLSNSIPTLAKQQQNRMFVFEISQISNVDSDNRYVYREYNRFVCFAFSAFVISCLRFD